MTIIRSIGLAALLAVSTLNCSDEEDLWSELEMPGHSQSLPDAGILDWTSDPGPAGLETINPHLGGIDRSPMGFMYWAPVLYENGLFPLLPYITSVRDQGERGTCTAFGAVASAEIILMDHQDLSEQAYLFHSAYFRTPPVFAGVPIGAEQEWPYNPGPCPDDLRYPGGALGRDIPCSQTVHQGILSEDGSYTSFSDVESSEQGRCVISTNIFDLNSEEELFDNMYHILNGLRYPISVSLRWNNFGLRDGFFVQHDGGDSDNNHAIAVVGVVRSDHIPPAAQHHPDFQAGEHYFILKNSQGLGRGDGGFVYMSASDLFRNLNFYSVFKYDQDSSVYRDCPVRSSAGVDWCLDGRLC